jgi:hypothetical protein
MRPTYKEAMGDEGAHIRLKLDTDQPIALSDFVAEFVGIGNQFDKFIAREYPDLKAESEIYIKEVRSGCIEADLVAWIVGGGGTLATAAWVIDKIDKAQVLAKFVDDVKERISPYFRKGGRNKEATKGDLSNFLKTTQAIASDPNGSANLEAAVFEDGERKVRAAFKFTSAEARRAETEITEHRRELEKKTDENQERVLLQFVRPSVEAGKPGKKGGERAVIQSIHKRALPVLYASGMAEERMMHEKMQLAGNVFRALFDVSVNVEIGATGRLVAYRITDVHNVIEDGTEGDLIDG